jgi:hypothetical protein
MRGETLEAFQKTRNAQILYSVGPPSNADQPGAALQWPLSLSDRFIPVTDSGRIHSAATWQHSSHLERFDQYEPSQPRLRQCHTTSCRPIRQQARILLPVGSAPAFPAGSSGFGKQRAAGLDRNH